MKKTILYNTRDAKGNDIVSEVEIKQFDVEKIDFNCSICHKESHEAVPIKKIVSSSFTDWAYVGDYVCHQCADLFSLYFYSYIVSPDGIMLLNVRELKNELISRQKPPFMFCITTSRKKHLFYRAVWNQKSDKFFVNLETETILTSNERMKELFLLVESLQTLGAPKERLKKCEIPFQVLQKLGGNKRLVLEKLRNEIDHSREIQIPLYCGQRIDKPEEEILCCIDSILKA